MLSGSRWNSCHVTEINAPIGIVWEEISDIDSWQWNQWVRLDAAEVATGTFGKARISKDGKCGWSQKDFSFLEVSRKRFTFSWTTKMKLCKCTNVMTLRALGVKKTELRHSQVFQGASPCLGLGHNFKKLQSYSLFINEALKNHVESHHFNSLLNTLSARELVLERSDCTMGTETSDTSRTNFWETPPHVRRKLISSFLEHDQPECTVGKHEHSPKKLVE